MKVGFIMSAIVLATVATSSALLSVTPAAYSQPISTYTSDGASYDAAFSIENNTGVTIKYKVRWGKKRAWKVMTLPSGSVMKHTYPLGGWRTASVPQPYVQFDNIAGDGDYTPQQYDMEFYATGYAGYGGPPNDTQPKQYRFKYAADGRSLDLFAR